MKNQLKISSTTKNDCLIVEIDQNTNEVLQELTGIEN